MLRLRLYPNDRNKVILAAGYLSGITSAQGSKFFIWSQQMNEKNVVWIMAGVLVALYVIVNVFAKNTSGKHKVKSLAYAGVMVALSFGLSYVKLYSQPQGGSITLLSMLPIMLYAYMFGVRDGLMAAFAYSILQCVQGVYFLNFLQFLFDYIIGFTVLGLAGAFHARSLKVHLPLQKTQKASIKALYAFINQFPFALVLGMTIGFVGRYLASVIAGYVFWGTYAPAGQHPLVYSLVYNLVLLIDGIIAVVGGVMLMSFKPLRQQIENMAV